MYKVILILDHFYLKYEGKSNCPRPPQNKLFSKSPALLGLIQNTNHASQVKPEMYTSDTAGLQNIQVWSKTLDPKILKWNSDLYSSITYSLLREILIFTLHMFKTLYWFVYKIKGNAQFISLYNPQKWSVNIWKY